MPRKTGRFASCILMQTAIVCGCVLSGCSTPRSGKPAAVHRLPPINHVPNELNKVTLPEYVIEPPDILSIQLIRAIPRSPYRLQALDSVSIQVGGTLPDAPIVGVYPIEPSGVVNFGVPYGAVKIAGLSVEEARAQITRHLTAYLRQPQVSVALAEIQTAQQLVGEFLVGPDGTVTLGPYGAVSVVGLTLEQARAVIESKLSAFLEKPIISLRVFAYNSKVYYIVVQGAGFGDTIYRFPITGNDTVLDALSQINGLQEISSKKMWIARPSHDAGHVQLLPIDYFAVAQHGAAQTNYQLLPGDRLFVAEDKAVAFDTKLAKLLTPLERMMGFSLLGAGTATRFSGPVLKGGGNPVNGRIFR